MYFVEIWNEKEVGEIKRFYDAEQVMKFIVEQKKKPDEGYTVYKAECIIDES